MDDKKSRMLLNFVMGLAHSTVHYRADGSELMIKLAEKNDHIVEGIVFTLRLMGYKNHANRIMHQYKVSQQCEKDRMEGKPSIFSPQSA